MLQKCVFAVQVEGDKSDDATSNDWKILGTGFFVRGEGSDLLGVTCHHVIAGAQMKGKIAFAGIETDSGYKRFRSEVVVQDEKHDIAVLVFKRSSDDMVVPKQIRFTNESIDDGKNIVAGRGVLITGYPLSLGVEDDTNIPVVRFGMIAQNSNKPFFLIDGIVSPGNSGSPVFALRHGEHKLVGMVTSYIPDNILLFSEQWVPTARLPYNSGLARAIKAEFIVKALEKANERLP